MAFQLALCAAPADRLLIDWLAALAAVEVATWRSGRLPETCSTTLTYDRAEASTRWAAWPIHTDCDCAAARRAWALPPQRRRLEVRLDDVAA
jgi:hypothetical protein